MIRRNLFILEDDRHALASRHVDNALGWSDEEIRPSTFRLFAYRVLSWRDIFEARVAAGIVLYNIRAAIELEGELCRWLQPIAVCVEGFFHDINTAILRWRWNFLVLEDNLHALRPCNDVYDAARWSNRYLCPTSRNCFRNCVGTE